MVTRCIRNYQCDMVLNVNALTEDRSDDTKDSSFEYQECVFVQFSHASHDNFAIQK
jgi:hypothetical protein